MPERSREERLQIMLSPEELTVLDDFRFKRRMPSRAAAIRELLRRGLAAEGFETAIAGSKSSDFGVTVKAPSGRPRPARLADGGGGKKGADRLAWTAASASLPCWADHTDPVGRFAVETVRLLRLTVPPTLLARANEVIE